MRYRQLGRTGLFVSELTLGTMTFGDSGGDWSRIAGVRQQEADELVRHAIEAGINLIDTADAYSQGQAEMVLGQSLRNLGVKRSDILVATKGYIQNGPGPNDRGASRSHVLDAVKSSLERLQLDYVDLYYIHGNDPVTPIDETMRVLDDLIRDGLVRYVGVSNWPAWKVARSIGISDRHGWASIACVQCYYSIAGRDLEREIVPLLNEEKLGLLVWSPLAGGLLSGKFAPDSSPEGARRSNWDFPPMNMERSWACIGAMRDIAQKRDVSVARVALAWLLAKPHVTTILIGARNVEQFRDNVAATELRLSSGEIEALDAVSALPLEYPGWMIERQASYRRP